MCGHTVPTPALEATDTKAARLVQQKLSIQHDLTVHRVVEQHFSATYLPKMALLYPEIVLK